MRGLSRDSTGSRHVASPCPSCRKDLDAATEPTDPVARPAPGSVTVCLYCATVLVYGDDMRLRSPTSQERDELAADRELSAKLNDIRRAVRGTIRRLQREN